MCNRFLKLILYFFTQLGSAWDDWIFLRSIEGDRIKNNWLAGPTAAAIAHAHPIHLLTPISNQLALKFIFQSTDGKINRSFVRLAGDGKLLLIFIFITRLCGNWPHYPWLMGQVITNAINRSLREFRCGRRAGVIQRRIKETDAWKQARAEDISLRSISMGPHVENSYFLIEFNQASVQRARRSSLLKCHCFVW